MAQIRMRIEATKKLFTVDEYCRMAEAGILAENDRVELIEGEIIQMSPIGRKHAARVDRATDLFTAAFRGKAIVRVQNPVRLNLYNEPVPDIALLKYRSDYYESQHPSPEDVLLIFEISDTTLRYDRNVKLPIYANCGIPEAWIQDVKGNALLVYRDPAGKRYKTQITLHQGETIALAAFPDITLRVDELLGQAG